MPIDVPRHCRTYLHHDGDASFNTKLTLPTFRFFGLSRSKPLPSCFLFRGIFETLPRPSLTFTRERLATSFALVEIIYWYFRKLEKSVDVD